MSTIDVRGDIPALEKMCMTFDRSSQRLTETISRVNNVAGALESGILLGEMSDEFVHGLRNSMAPGIVRLLNKLLELSADLRQVIEQIKRLEEQDRSRFNN